MAENTDYKNSSTKHDDTAGLVEASESKRQNGKKRKILIFSLIAVLIIGIVVGVFFLFNQNGGVFSSNKQVTVTFDSMEGSEIESQTIPKGERLTRVETPSRSGFIFAGWYYEEAPVNAYKAEDVFSEDTTLYAGWYEPDIKVDKAEYIKDCDSNISFVVQSESTLTDANLSDYIDFAYAGFEDGKTLSVKQHSDGYLLYAEGGFTPGNTYSITILDPKALSFIKAGDTDVTGLGITNYNFTIYKENINNVVLKVTPQPLSSDDVQKFEVVGNVATGETDNERDIGKPIYRALMADSNGDFKAGDFISLGIGEQDSPANQYYKIIKVTKDNSGLYLYMVTPEMNEVYSEFELYYTGDAVTFEENQESSKELEQTFQTALQKSAGYDFLARTIATSIKSSPTLQRTVAGSDANAQQRYQDLSVGELTDLLKVGSLDIAFGKTKDDANKENGVYARIKYSTGDIDIVLSDKLKLTYSLSMSEDITETASGWLRMEDWDVYIDEGVNLTNKLDMSFSAVIATDNDTINITEEIQNLIDSQSDDKTQQIVDNLNKENLFGEDLDYVEILSRELGQQTVSIYEVLTIQFKLDFKVSLGMRVSLDLNFSSTEMRKIGMSNINYSAGSLEASKTKMRETNQRLYSEIHFTATLKGKMGIRAGVAAGVNFSTAHMNSVLSFGFTAEVGVYEEISGYIRFDYDYVNSQGRDPKSSTSLAGGLMSEMGIYVELSLNWNVFSWEGKVIIAELKFPILKIGALEFASEFEQNDNSVTFNTTSYNIKNSTDDLLKLKYIDISGGDGGVTINVKLPAANDAYVFWRVKDATGKGDQNDLKYVSVGKDTGMVTVADNAPERLDFTVVTQYTKGSSLFSKDLELITKNINFTYMKYNVDDSSQKYKATFYLPDGSVLEQKEYYVGQVPVPPAEETYRMQLINKPYRLKDWSKPWKEEIKPLYADTDYHMDTEPNLRNITFTGYVYNETTGKYKGGVAVVPSLVGEMPIPPSTEDLDIQKPWKFYKWEPDLRPVEYDYTYSPVTWTSGDACWTSFYLDDNTLISEEYVPFGALPTPPDMSQYNTADRQYVGWWPTLHASTYLSQSYYAITEQITYKVCFYGGDDEPLCFTGHYGDTITSDMLAGLKKTSPNNDYVYVLSDYGLKLPYSFGTALDADGLPAVDLGVEVKFTATGVSKTVTFDANGGKFADNTTAKTVTGPYASEASFSEVPVKATNAQYAYTFIGWSTKPDATTGNSFASFIITGNSRLYAVYSRTPLWVNLVFNASPGHFTDGSAQKTVQIANGSTAPDFTQVPVMDSTDMWDYTFTGWSPACVPGTVVTSDKRFDAQYSSQYRDYTVTFDAGAGTFADGQSTLTQTYHYGNTIVPPADPIRADTTTIDYTFDHWSPAVAATATENVTYTAIYSSAFIGADPTGIIVSDGVNSEDINLYGHGGVVSGYSFSLVDHDGDGSEDTENILILEITANGRTVSGSNTTGTIYLRIAPGVTSVTLNGLTLSGAYPYGEGVLHAQGGTPNPLTVNIAGNCTFANSGELAYAAYLDRPVKFQGITGSSPTLSFTTPGNLEASYAAIYAIASLEAKDLALTVTSANGYPIFSDGDDYNLTFDNVPLTVLGAYGIGCNKIVIKGAANVSFSVVHPSVSLVALYVKSELRFEDFTGVFQAINSADGPAVVAGDIIFDVPANYNLHGAEVKTYDDGYGPYDIFVIAGTETILSAVTVEGN